MRAAVFIDSGQPLVVEEVTPLDAGPRDVIVRVTASGVCHTDLSKANGSLPFSAGILGHEGVGTVEFIGSGVRRVKIGDRVIGSLTPTCAACWFCARGEAHLCTASWSFLNKPRAARQDGLPLIATNGLGTFAETMTVLEDSLVKVDSDLPDEQLALIGCAVTTGVSSVFEVAQVHPGASVVVIGCGGVGLAVVQGSRVAGAACIIAVDPVPWKRDLALKLGATHSFDPAADGLVDVVRSCTAGRGTDYAFDVVGQRATFRQAIDLVRRGGTAIEIGIPDMRTDLAVPPTIVYDSKRLCGTVYGDAQVNRDFERIVHLVERGALDLGAMVSRVVRLDDVNAALQALDHGEVVRTVLRMDG